MQEHETKAAIDKLRDCESRFRQMAENIREVFFLVEAGSGRVMYLSPAYEEIWGRSCASVYADPDAWIEAVHPDDGAAVREHYGKGLAGGNLQYEYRIVRPDGAMRWIERRDFPVHDAAGRTTRVAGVASDVTERKWVALELSDSKLRLDSIVTSAMDAIVSVDDGHRIVLANAAAEQMFGYAEGELLGKPLDQLLPPRFQVAHAAQIAGFSKAGTTSRKMGSLRPVSGVRRNGEKFTIEVSISRNESTGRRVFTAILRDVTERNRVLGALHESERRFSELLGNVELASVMLDRQARVTFCNDSLLRLTGWQREEVVGRSWFEVFLPSMRGDEDAAFGEQLDGTPGAWHLENEIVTRSGELRRMRWHSVVLRSTDGVAIGSASLGEDITEQKRAEIRVQRLNRVYAMLSQINTLIVRARDREELFRGACGIW